MKKFLPIIDWLTNYKKVNLSGDISAGLTVGIMLIPQGMAYAMLAGMDPIYGLYAATIPLLLYAVFGTSRQLSVGPVAMFALLIASGVGALAEVGSTSFIALAILLSLIVGVIQLLMGLFKMGFLVNFLSHPIISGFTTAAAIFIAVSQLKYVIGIQLPRGTFYENIQGVFTRLDEINWATIAVGFGGIAAILILRKINRKIPFPLIVVLLGLGASYFFGLKDFGVQIINEVPSGLPAFSIPVWDTEAFLQLLPIALTISLIGFTESMAVSKSIQKKHKDYEIDPSQELVALGIANIGGSFFQSFPVTGGFARSAVNDQAGAKTGLAAIISACVVILTLLFLTPYFELLPKAILAAIIIVAIFGLIDIKEAKHLWKTDRKDFIMFMITALSTLFLGIEQGIFVGVAVSIIGLLIHVSYPHIAELGMDVNSRKFLNIDRFSHISPTKDVLIVRLDARLFFANTRYFQDRLKAMESKRESIRAVILDASGINGMDSSAVHALSDMIDDYHKRNIQFLMTNVKGPVRDVLRRTKMRAKIGESHFFLSIHDALAFLDDNIQGSHTDLTLQTNEK